MRVRGTGGAAVAGATACVLALLLGAGPAHAATRDGDSYRYWSLWEQKDSGLGWSYATKGASVMRPGDGAVIGFRFALSEDSRDAAKPRGETRFGSVCARTEPKKDRKRIALSIDFGTAAHAPDGEKPPEARTACARVAEDASAAEALAEVAEPLRYDSAALLCAIEGYPERGCGEQVSQSENREKKAEGKDTGDDGSADDGGGQGDGGLGSATGVAVGLAVVAFLAVAAVRRSRRR